jgi:hypothetical protein
MANGDGISFTMDSEGFTEMVVQLGDGADKATKYALRATGRFIQRSAKAKAPVYHGTDPRATAESGNLKKSIKNAKRLTGAGGAYSLKVGPFGSKKAGTAVTRHGTAGALSSVKAGTSTKGQVRGVPLYRAQMEAQYGYMAGGLAAADAGAQAIYESAYAKAFAKATA